MKRYNLIERRKYIRLETPVNITYSVPKTDRIYSTTAKNISADGLGLEVLDGSIQKADIVELKLNIPDIANPIHAKGRVIWKRKLSLEDNAPFSIGIEFIGIEEDNKNTFLKFLCDLIYNLPKGARRENQKQ